MRKGDGKDVHHKDGNPENNTAENVTVMSAVKNRALSAKENLLGRRNKALGNSIKNKS